MSSTQPATDQEKSQAKEKLSKIGERLKSDTAFHDQYKADPVATLKSNGVTDREISALRSHVAKKKGEDVSGYDYWYWDDWDTYDTYWYYIY